MDWKTRITRDPKIMLGKPTIKGTRISVELVIGLMAQGWPEADILESYPHITREDVIACLAYAAALVEAEKAHTILA